MQKVQKWFVYCLASASQKRSYVGASIDPTTRLLQHNGEKSGGARYTRQDRPWKIHIVRGPFDKHNALRLERLWKIFSKRLRNMKGSVLERRKTALSIALQE